MAILGKWSGGVIGSMYLTGAWVAPNGLFPTQDRNDGSAYTFTSSTSLLTLPSSGLADGYLIIASFEHETSQNDRHTPQGKIIQASGTGNFVGGPTGGYCRDNSENRAYVRCWAFVDNPSASATFQFQWKRDNEDANAGDGTRRSEFQVIPFYYTDIGMYTSADHTLMGGTTPNQVPGWATTLEGTNITRSSNVITVTGDNKRYLIFGSQFFEGRAGRTQRWHGLRIDGTKEDAAKAYSYYRESDNDENGELFTHIIETITASRTIDQFCYRGDGVASGEGGADGDGSDPGVGNHTLVVIELNDDAEVFGNIGSTNQNIATTGPVDIQISKVVDVKFNDSGSFTRTTDIAMNCEQAMDILMGANLSWASQAITTGTRFTCYGEFTKNGTEDSDSFAGDYTRNNQSSTDTFGGGANLLGFTAVANGDDVGVSATELSGTEGGAGAQHIQVGWAGLWGINLDTLEVSTGTDYEEAYNDAQTMSDGIEIEVGNKLADTQDITDDIAMSVGNKLVDDIGITDSLSKVSEFKRSLADTQDMSDAVGLNVGLNLSDTFGITDSLAAGLSFSLSLSDTVGLSDELTNGVGLDLSDTLAITDGFEKTSEYKRSLADTLGIADNFAKVSGHIASLSDNLGITDSFSKYSEFKRSLSDTQNISDELINGVGLDLSDSLGITDGFTKVSEFKRNLTDTQSLSDALVNAIGLTLSEVLALADVYVDDTGGGSDYQISLFDTQNISDAIENKIGLSLSDIQNIADGFEKVSEFKRDIADTQSISDALVNGVGLSLSDVQSISDELVNRIGLSLSDVQSIADSLFNSVGLTLSDIMALADTYTDDGATDWVLGLSDNMIFTDGFEKTSGYKHSLSDVLTMIDVFRVIPEALPSNIYTVDAEGRAVTPPKDNAYTVDAEGRAVTPPKDNIFIKGNDERTYDV